MFLHVIEGKISNAKMVQRECPTVMVIFIPVDKSILKAIVYLQHAHNHPMQPKIKPSSEDKVKITKAINAVGLRGLSVQKLLNGV